MEQNENNLNENSDLSEKQKELSIKSYDDFILSLESPTVPLEHIHLLIDKITQDDPKIKVSFENFQEDMFHYVVKRFKEVQKEENLKNNQNNQEHNQNNQAINNLNSNNKSKESTTNKITNSTKNTNEINGLKSSIWLKSSSEYLNNLESFKDLKPYLETKEFKQEKLTVLNNDFFSAYLRYEDNNIPLVNLLAKDELSQLETKYNKSTKHYKPLEWINNMSVDIEYEIFIKIRKEIFKKYELKVLEFKNLLSSDAWKLLLEQSWSFYYRTNLQKQVNNSLWYKEDNDSKISNEIQQKTAKLYFEINNVNKDLNKETQDYFNKWKFSKENPTEINQISQKYLNIIDLKLKDYAKWVWNDIINNPEVLNIIKNKWVFKLPVWNWNEVILDFSNMDNIDFDNPNKEDLKNKISQSFNKNFDSIYRSELHQKIYDWIINVATSIKNNPWKTLIDLSSIIIAWSSWLAVAAWTDWVWIVTAWVVATAVDNWYRAGMYEAFIEWWYKEWLWITDKDKSNDIVYKKTFELATNIWLFWIFKWTWAAQSKLLKSLWEDGARKLEESSMASFIKSWIEAWFFTEFLNNVDWLQNWLNSDKNFKEVLKNMSNMSTSSDVINTYLYNLLFIISIKKVSSWIENSKLFGLSSRLENEMKLLEEKWYNIVDNWTNTPSFFKWINEVDISKHPDFKKFREVNKKLLHFTETDDYKKPENGRWWKNLIKLADERYELLKKYSNETQDWKIWYALKDETIWETISEVWIKDWSWVSEWLLRKSWFDDLDIEDFREWRLKSEKVTDRWQKEALKSMENASEVVSNQVLNIENDLVNILNNWWTNII